MVRQNLYRGVRYGGCFPGRLVYGWGARRQPQPFLYQPPVRFFRRSDWVITPCSFPSSTTMTLSSSLSTMMEATSSTRSRGPTVYGESFILSEALEPTAWWISFSNSFSEEGR